MEKEKRNITLAIKKVQSQVQSYQHFTGDIYHLKDTWRTVPK